MESFEAAYPRQDYVLTHPSDAHLVGAGLLYGDIGAGERPKQAFAAVEAASVRIPPSTSLASPAAAGARPGTVQGRTRG